MAGALYEEVKISQAITAAAGASGTGTVNGATLDMQGFDAVMAVIHFGAIAPSGDVTIKMQQDTDSAMGSAQDLEGTGQTVGAGLDNNTFVIDLQRPRERYVRIVAARHSSNAATIGSAHYYQYNARNLPVTQGGSVTVEGWTFPAEGTA